MYKIASLVLIALAIANLTHADEPSLPATELKVYRVGDLVSANAINLGASFGETSSKEWYSEYAATLDALGELESFVIAMTCSEKPMAIRAYSPTLSLIVRQTPDGHQEIAKLLAAMRDDGPVSIRLECRALPCDPSGINSPGLTKDEQRRLESLLENTRLTKEQASELRDLISKDVVRMHVDLKAGRRTPWGHTINGPLTATGRVDHASGIAQIRIDYMADQVRERFTYGSQLLILADGESAMFHQYLDRGCLAWFVTASVPKQSHDIAPQQPK